MKKVTTYFIFAFIMILTSCGEEPTQKKKESKKKVVKKEIVQTPLVNPPIKEMDPKFQIIEVDPIQGGNFIIPETFGSKIIIPANVFVDEKRNKITSKVELRYREFHDAVDIFLAGIPMDYDAAGMMKRFQTAGMFDIRAYAEGKEVFVDSGKVVKVIFGSNTGGNDYNFFRLDEKKTRNWHYIGGNEGKGNREKKKIIASIERKVKAMKVPLTPDHFVFNYLAILDVYLKDDEKLITKSKKDKGIELKIKRYGVTWQNFYNYESILFNGNTYLSSLMIWKKITDKEFPTWGNQADTKLTLKEGNIYNLEFSMKGKPKYNYEIEAVMPLKSLMQFTPEYWKAEYDKAFAQAMKAEESRLRTMADVYRTFSFNQLGIYNYDKFMKDTLHIQVNADVKFDRDAGDIKNITICFVSGDGKSLIQFPYDLWTNMTLVPDRNAKIFALLPENYIAMVDQDQYNKIDFKGILKSGTKPKVTLEFKTAKKISSDVELKELILGKAI